MIGSRVTKRYARALFELAREKDLLKVVQQDLSLLRQSIESSEDLRVVLESPVVQAADKRKALDKAFEKKVHPVTLRFIDLLLEKGRENLLPDIIWQFGMLADAAQGVIRGQLETAFPLNDSLLAALKRRLDRITGKNVIIQQRVVPELLGGFVVQMNDTVIDTSLKNQLARMREKLVSG